MNAEKLCVHAVILAGGRGTRFWPRSRTRTPKQLLNIVGQRTMLEQTVARLCPLIPPQQIWTVTNDEQAPAVGQLLPNASQQCILSEPTGRSTAAAIALAAVHIRHAAKGDALMAVLPADHFIAEPRRYRRIVRAALRAALEPGRLLVLGVPPTRPETGFGYIERTGRPLTVEGFPVYSVRRFTEKPDLALAKDYVASPRYQWNAGMFFWRISSFLNGLKEFLPETYRAFERLGRHVGKSSYPWQLKRVYRKIKTISVDYALLERATAVPGPPRVFVLPAQVGWSDIGSWDAVYELLAKGAGENVFAGPGLALDARGNFFWSPRKFVAALGVDDLVVVETPDALLVCPRGRAQEVSKIVQSLEQSRRKDLL